MSDQRSPKRTADDVIAAMEHSRSMRPVDKPDAWILVEAIRDLREELSEERRHGMEAASMARDYEQAAYEGWRAQQDGPW